MPRAHGLQQEKPLGTKDQECFPEMHSQVSSSQLWLAIPRPFHQDGARNTGCPRQRVGDQKKTLSPSLAESLAQLKAENTLVSRAICQGHGDRYGKESSKALTKERKQTVFQRSAGKAVQRE